MALNTLSRPAPTKASLSWQPYAIAIGLSILAKLPTLTNNIIFIDEPAYLAHGARLDSVQAFFLAFQYRTETKFQLGILPYMLAQFISQPYAILFERILGLLAVITSACLLLLISKRVFGGYGPGLFGAGDWLLYLNSNELTVAPLLEYFQTPLVLLSILLTVKSAQTVNINNRRFYLFGTGVVISLAALVKPPGIMLGFASVGFLLLYQIKLGRPATAWRTWFVDQVWLAMGIIIPLAVFIMPYFFNSVALAELKFSLIDTTIDYSSYQKSDESLVARSLYLIMEFGLCNLALLAATGLTLVWPQRKPKLEDRFAVYCQIFFLLAALTLFLGFATGRVKTHYLIPIVPLIALVAGRQLGIVYQNLRSRTTIRLARAAFVVWLVFLQLVPWMYYISLYVNLDGHIYTQPLPVDQVALVNYIKANSGPHDSIWIYYNSPEFYWLADRKPATSEPMGSYLQIFHNEVWFSRIARELDAEQTKIVIELDKPRYGDRQVNALLAMPKISQLLTEKYNCSRTVVTGATICQRKLGN